VGGVRGGGVANAGGEEGKIGELCLGGGSVSCIWEEESEFVVAFRVPYTLSSFLEL
jgi:hypothetical protein